MNWWHSIQIFNRPLDPFPSHRVPVFGAPNYQTTERPKAISRSSIALLLAWCPVNYGCISLTQRLMSPSPLLLLSWKPKRFLLLFFISPFSIRLYLSRTIFYLSKYHSIEPIFYYYIFLCKLRMKSDCFFPLLLDLIVYTYI